MIAAERADADPLSRRVWHQGWPAKPVLYARDPPGGPGRYHRAGGRPTWYGSSSEPAAWAEFFRHVPEGLDPAETRRRVGRADYRLLALDLTSDRIRRELGISERDLVSDDLAVCQTLADLAADAGFEAVIGPSAALDGESTLAVFGTAIVSNASEIVDMGVRTAPGREGGT